jgi:hypothetical protein
MTDDLNDFLEGKEQVPREVYAKTLNYLKICLNPKRTMAKFYITNLMGALLTISLCPQYGFGPLGGDAGILHYIMDFGPIWCGIFCASIFMAGGNFFSLIFLKPTEREWIGGHIVRVLLPWISLVFFVGMIAKYYAPGNLHHNTVSYHLSWYFTALFLSMLMVKKLYHQSS